MGAWLTTAAVATVAVAVTLPWTVVGRWSMLGSMVAKVLVQRHVPSLLTVFSLVSRPSSCTGHVLVLDTAFTSPRADEGQVAFER